jgi:Tannase and feruloyl esterase
MRKRFGNQLRDLFVQALEPLVTEKHYSPWVRAPGNNWSNRYGSRGRRIDAKGGNHCDELLERCLRLASSRSAVVAGHAGSTAGDRRTIDRTRPLCPYPQVAIYKGSGSIDEAASFACRAVSTSTPSPARRP